MRACNNEFSGQNRVPTLALPAVLKRFVRCESGTTSIEYGLICSLIFLAIVSSLQTVGSKTAGMHNKIQGSL